MFNGEMIYNFQIKQDIIFVQHSHIIEEITSHSVGNNVQKFKNVKFRKIDLRGRLT